MRRELGRRGLTSAEIGEYLNPRKPLIIMSGLGNNGTVAARAIEKSGRFVLSSYALSSEAHRSETVDILGKTISLLPFEESIRQIGKLQGFKDEMTIAVDYTVPAAVEPNGKAYAENRTPFVMGTTGGNVQAVIEAVKESEICAVISPNMAAEVVAFQATMENIARQFPDLLKGGTLDIVESHQQGKKDTSGTAKAMVEKPDGSAGILNALGLPYKVEQIKENENRVRDPKEQREMGVPEPALEGHGWHNYVITSETDNPGIDLLYDELFRFISMDPVFSAYAFYDGPPDHRMGLLASLPFLEEKTGKDLSVSEEAHTFSLDETVSFSLYHQPGKTLVISHNVNGREVYAQGTLKALEFLAKKMKAGEKGKVYTMADVIAEKN